ncbi:lysosome-associated membrane glycoprotein 3 isoform X2 [Mixophyes fleayi]|uniref:lysosome-associated membrane glycoprotein 3 isoform X2 n=1 Tax=Mixophyes fleayi TaxID=3061075 RepID=UPI003F4D813F
MSHLTSICSVLLISSIFLVDMYAETSPTSEPIGLSNFMQAITTHAPTNTTTHATSNTTHATSNTTHATSNTTHLTSNTTHATSNTTHATSNTTTHASSNTTTHAPSNTTTHAPSNTTTHAPSNTTTHAPSNTTTHAPSNTTTHTTAKPTPTLPPVPSTPERGNYTVKDDKSTCVIANMGLELVLENSTKKSYFNVAPKQTNSSGACGDSKANLLLTFTEGSINFAFVKESKVYYIDEVSVSFYLASAGNWNGTASKLKLLSTDIGYSVKCKDTPAVKLGNNLQLVLSDVKLQAFDITNGIFGKEEMCSHDRNIIAVAISVTVIIVLIIAVVIYFIWHKRRSSGYQQI